MRAFHDVSSDRSERDDIPVARQIGLDAPSASFAAPGVEAATGRLRLALPLPSSPARGAAPALALAYSSGGGNSVFGHGWTVPLSFIGPDLRLRYPAWDGSDEMSLDGGETLVPEMAGAQPFAEDVAAPGGPYAVTRFRPRVDPTLDRIERWRRIADGDVHWRVLRGNGAVDVYGRTPAARLSDPEAAGRTLRWMIERSHDPAGNVIHYGYAADIRQAGDDPAGLTGGAASAGLYLKTVSFGATAPYDPATEALPGFHFLTVFDYGDHDPNDPRPAPDRPAPPHPEPFVDRRGGFAATVTRLCRRILHFRRFPELGPQAQLTDALELTHEADDGPVRLTEVRAARFAPRPGGGLDRAVLPAQRFGYGPFRHDSGLHQAEGEGNSDLPGGLWHPARPKSPGAAAPSQPFWADLRGEGLPGMLVAHPGGASFARNLGGGRFAAPLPLDPAPDLGGLQSGTLTIEDAEGTGRLALAVRTPGREGFYPLTETGGTGPFVPFATRPVLPSAEGAVLPVDLDGDGRTDLLVAGGVGAVWLPGLGAAGIDTPREVSGADAAHALWLRADRRIAVVMADMTGDGLADIAILGAGAVRVLPGLGRGCFGAEVRMREVPAFLSDPDFDARRLALANLDGTGAASLVYAAGDAVIYALNRGGGRFAPARRIPVDPAVGPVDRVQAIDLTGAGTDAISWAAAGTGALAYLTPAGPARPHLLVSHATGAGLETRVDYGTLAEASRDALAAGRPWRSSVPFPLQMVTRTVTEDRLSGARSVLRYGYAHPFYDLAEREFRGFARVETRDTDEGDEAAQAAAPNDPFRDPTLIERIWHDVGAPAGHPLSPAALAGDWWPGDAGLRPQVPADPPGAAAAARARARTGAALRVERWAADRPVAPLSVETRTVFVAEVQPPGAGRPAVLRSFPAEVVRATYEGEAGDPFVQHSLTLAADPLGFVTEAATLSCGRRTADPSLPAEVQAEQARTHVAIERTSLTLDSAPAAPRRYLLRRPWRRQALVLEGLGLPAGRLLRADELRQALAAAAPVAFEAPRGAGLALRLVAETRDRFLAPDLAAELAFGTLGTLAEVARRYTLALTDTLRAAVYGADLAAADRAELGYVDLDGDGAWWMRSGRSVLGAPALARFHLPDALEDAAGRVTQLAYDPHLLVLTSETDPVGNTTSRRIDYRLFATVELTDPNGDRVGIVHDLQGLVTARAVLGRVGAGAEGDTLADPTETFQHDLLAWEEGRGAVSIRHERREVHGDPASRRLLTVTYLDGTGAPLQSFTQVAPGPAEGIGPGGVVAVAADPRFRVSARARLSTKGRAAAAFHPWFAAGTAFVADPRLTDRGASAIARVDAAGRTLRTNLPDGTFSRTTYRPWVTLAEDPNDTVPESPWYAALGQPDPAGAAPADPVAWTAWATAAHAGTPGEAHVDATGAPILDREGTRILRTDRTPGGHRTRALDGSGRLVSETLTDLAGRTIGTRAMEDRGPTRIVLDAAGQMRRILRPDGGRWTMTEDAAGRPVGVTLSVPGAADRTVAWTVWGEAHPEADARRLRGRAWASFDESGATFIERFDLHGVPMEATKRFALGEAPAEWSALSGLGPVAAAAAADGLLDAERFTTRTLAVDAFGRALLTEGPDGSRTAQSFDDGGMLARLSVQPGGAGPALTVIDGQDFDAWGTLVAQGRGNGITLTREIDPALRRVSRLWAVRASDGLAILDARYTYDPVGHVTRLADAATPTLYFANAAVSGDMTFRYDGLHQLVAATGRELAALTPPSWAMAARTGLPHANDATAVRAFSQTYRYDAAGNLTEIAHRAGAAGWRRRMRYVAGTNRLVAVSEPGDADGVYSLAVASDPDGRIVTLPGGAGPLSWSAVGQLAEADLGGGGTALYRYAAGGGRARKIVRRPGGIVEETLYLGALEVRRRRQGGVLTEDRRTILVRSGPDLVARIDRQILPAGGADLIRFRLRDQTGLIGAETDATGALVTAETYHPFGTTAWRASTNDAEAAASRYRWADRAPDDETGLVPMGLRLYAPWIGRWISPDPAGAMAGPNLFAYSGNDPVNRHDPSGLDGESRPIPGVGADPAKWSWEEMTTAARHLGLKLMPEVTAQNYRDYWDAGNRKWMVVQADPDTSPDPDASTGSGGAAKDNTDAQPPPDADATGAAEGGGDKAGATSTDSPGEGAKDGNGGAGKGESAGSGEREDAAKEGGVGLADALNPGAAAVNAYNSHQRSVYSKGNVDRAIKAVDAIEDAVRAGNEASAWEIAEKASNERNAARTASQQKMKWTGGQQLSDLIDKNPSVESVRAKYSSGTNKPMGSVERLKWKVFTPGLPEPVPGPRGGSLSAVARDVAIGTGKTNRIMSGLSKVGKPLGIIGTVVGAGVGVYRVVNAPPGERARVAGEEIGSFIGGAAGFAAGSALAAAGLALLVSNPVGWVALGVIAATFVVGSVFAYAGSAIGSKIGGWIGDLF